MRIGQIVKLPDGRMGTVVFNGLTGVGIKWGEHVVTREDLDGTTGDCLPVADDHPARQQDWPWFPDAMLRDPEMSERLDIECVCDERHVTEVES